MASPLQLAIPASLELSLTGALYFADGVDDVVIRTAVGCIERYHAIFGTSFDWTYTAPDYEWTHKSSPRYFSPRKALLEPSRLRAGKRKGGLGVDCRGSRSVEEQSDVSISFDCNFPPGGSKGAGASLTFRWPKPSDASSLDAFRSFFLTIARALRAHGGFGGYSLWCRRLRDVDARHDLYETARKHPGVHLTSPYDPNHTLARGEKVGEVSWLNVLGKGLLSQLGGRESLSRELGDDYAFDDLGDDAVCIQAGPQPLLGDSEQNDWPEAYVQLARRLEPVRIRDSVAFLEHKTLPYFDSDSATEWQRRFDPETDRRAFLTENTSCLLRDVTSAFDAQNRARFATGLARLRKRPLRLPDLYSGMPKLALAALARGWREEGILALEVATSGSTPPEYFEQLLCLYREDKTYERALEFIPRALPIARERSAKTGKPFAAIYRHAAYLYAVAGMKDEAFRVARLAREAGRAAFLVPFLADTALVEELRDLPEFQELFRTSG